MEDLDLVHEIEAAFGLEPGLIPADDVNIVIDLIYDFDDSVGVVGIIMQQILLRSDTKANDLRDFDLVCLEILPDILEERVPFIKPSAFTVKQLDLIQRFLSVVVKWSEM